MKLEGYHKTISTNITLITVSDVDDLRSGQFHHLPIIRQLAERREANTKANSEGDVVE